MNTPLSHVSFRGRPSGLLVPGAAGPAILDSSGREVAAHGDVGRSDGGVVYRKPDRPTFIDVFCGCGGASLGFLGAGMEGLAAIDLDIWALATYWLNLAGPESRWHGEHGVIREAKGKTRVPEDLEPGNGHFSSRRPTLLDDEDEPRQLPVRNVIRTDVAALSAADLLRIIDMPPGAVTMMHGSPPCQGFSVANSKRFIDDPRNALYKEFVRLVAGVRPFHVSIENVSQMLTFGDAWQQIEQDLRTLGYSVGAKILDSCAYGVPQFRPRAIVSANLHGIPPQWPVPTCWGERDRKAFERFPDLWEQVCQAKTLGANPQPTELCMVMPTTSGQADGGPYVARLVERRGNQATVVDPFGKQHEARWTTVLGFGAHTRQQMSLFDVAAAGGAT